MAAMELQGLTKEYEGVTGIDSLTFSVGSGELFGLLGPQGAGKTTTIRTVLGIQSPTAGKATLLGYDTQNEQDLRRAKANTGYLPAVPAFDESATGAEILDSHGQMKGDTRREELVARFDLPLDRRVRDYSTSDVQKLALVAAFMHDPALVLMDEPTLGLDAFDSQRFNEFVREERRRDVTIVLSSRVLSEVQQLCDRVAVLRDGRLLGTEPVESLRSRCGTLVTLRIAEAVSSSAFEIDGVSDLSARTVSVGGDLEATTVEPNDSRPGEASNVVTEVSFTFTGDINELIETVDSYPLLEFDLETAPLDTVFQRLYDDTTAV